MDEIINNTEWMFLSFPFSLFFLLVDMLGFDGNLLPELRGSLIQRGPAGRYTCSQNTMTIERKKSHRWHTGRI